MFRMSFNSSEIDLAFLLETSNKTSLTLKQACAVESCLKASGRFCILLTVAKNINICDKVVSTQNEKKVIIIVV